MFSNVNFIVTKSIFQFHRLTSSIVRTCTLNYSTYEFFRQLQGLQLQSKFILNVWPCITFECIPVVHSHNFPTTLNLIYFAYIKQLCILFICSSPGRDKFMFSVRKHVLGHLFSSFCISS